MPRLRWLLLLSLAFGCDRPQAPAEPAAAPKPVRPVGRCENVTVPPDSRCELESVHPLTCSDCDPGEGLYRIYHRVTVAGIERVFRTAVVKAPTARFEELRKLLSSHSPVGCSGVIVNPPCNPQATHVTLDLAWPDWAVSQRGW
jgi:hypothetical protein